MSLAVDTTKRNKKYVITYTLVGIACFVMFIVSILRYVYLNVLEPVPIFFYAMLVWILLLRCKPTYDVSVERKYLKIVKHDICKVFEIPYREIAAIFSYQPKLMRTVKFRYSYRLNSALDARTLWTLAWRRSFDDGSEANVRIYFKASKEVMDALAEKMPNRVNVPEELADFNMLVKEGVIVNNERKLKEAEAEILDKSVEQLKKPKRNKRCDGCIADFVDKSCRTIPHFAVSAVKLYSMKVRKLHR